MRGLRYIIYLLNLKYNTGIHIYYIMLIYYTIICIMKIISNYFVYGCFLGKEVCNNITNKYKIKTLTND